MKIILIIVIISSSISLKSQCNCQKTIREDGTNITQCPPTPISYDDNSQIGLSAATNGINTYINLMIRFATKAQEISSDLTLSLEDGNQITLPLANKGLAYIDNSEISQAVFETTILQQSKIKASEIKTVSFKLANGLLYTYQPKLNANILILQLECL